MSPHFFPKMVSGIKAALSILMVFILVLGLCLVVLVPAAASQVIFPSNESPNFPDVEHTVSTFPNQLTETESAKIGEVASPATNIQPGLIGQDSTTGSTSGNIYQTDGNTPVAGALIEARGLGISSFGSAYSNADGSYTVQNFIFG